MFSWDDSSVSPSQHLHKNKVTTSHPHPIESHVELSTHGNTHIIVSPSLPLSPSLSLSPSLLLQPNLTLWQVDYLTLTLSMNINSLCKYLQMSSCFMAMAYSTGVLSPISAKGSAPCMIRSLTISSDPFSIAS